MRLDESQEGLLEHNRAMQRLIAVVQELSLARDLERIMTIVRSAARALSGADGATFVLRDDGFCFYADEDAISPLWKGMRFPMSHCISGWSMLNAMPAVIPDIYADTRIPADAYRPTFVKSLLMVPIRTTDPIGAIGTYWATHHHPKDREVELLQSLANTTAVAMENVQLLSELESRVRLRTAQLELANTELEAFSYSVAHDLRGPLQNIGLNADLLGMRKPELYEACTARIESEVRRMAALIDDLFRLASTTSTPLRMEPVDLSALAADIVAGLRQQAPNRVVDVVIEPGLKTVGDAGLLKIVLENLLANAWKYTGKQPVARITFRQSAPIEGEPAYEISDNGVGFDMQRADRLFQPFQRLHKNSEFAGTGIGLATVSRIIRKHGGVIRAQATPGEGATFSFSLPGRD